MPRRPVVSSVEGSVTLLDYALIHKQTCRSRERSQNHPSRSVGLAVQGSGQSGAEPRFRRVPSVSPKQRSVFWRCVCFTRKARPVRSLPPLSANRRPGPGGQKGHTPPLTSLRCVCVCRYIYVGVYVCVRCVYSVCVYSICVYTVCVWVSSLFQANDS